MAENMFDVGLAKTAANYQALSPVSFLRRAALVYPEKVAVIHGDRKFTYRTFHERCCRLASALTQRGVGPGDCVSILANNTPEMLEAHYGVPMLGGVLNSLNFRLDAATIGFILDHGDAKALIVDREFSATARAALAKLEREILVIDIEDPLEEGQGSIGEIDYESFLAEGEPDFPGDQPQDEWQAISLLYTSGTTGNPKGCVYHHRGAYLNAIGNLISVGLNTDSVYLWTLPMFHCDGWTFTWAVTAACATHVCLRRVDPAVVYPMIEQYGVTHMCGGADRPDIAGERAGPHQAAFQPSGAVRHRRRRPAFGGHRIDGGLRLSGSAPLRPDRNIRAGHPVRLAGRLEGAIAARAVRPHGPPGGQLPDTGAGHGARPGDQ